MASLKITVHMESEIVNHWNAGMNAVKIADAVGLGPTSVYRVLLRHGIRPSKAKDRPYADWRRKVTIDQESDISSRYLSGEDMTAIAESHNCHPQTVSNVVIRLGLKRRPVGGPRRPLTEDQIDEIAIQYANGTSKEAIAKNLGVGFHKVTAALGPQRRAPGRVRNVAGYILVGMSPDDSLAAMRQAGGYVMEHRLVMARHLGRPLLRNETVHHINNDPSDNRIENLQLRNGNHGKGSVYMCKACGSHDIQTTRLAGGPEDLTISGTLP